MRLLALFKKTILENFRDWKIIILVLTFSPFFVFLMNGYLRTAVNTFRVIVINRDLGAKAAENDRFFAGEALISEMMNAKYPDGTPVLKVSREESIEKARRRLLDKAADLAVEIPENFSMALAEYKAGNKTPTAKVKTYGDPSNAKYIMAAAGCDAIAYQYTVAAADWRGPLDLETEAVGGRKTLNDFDLYVPSLLALALMMLMFTTAASVIKEKDKETLIRLRLSNMRVWEFLLSISLTQLIIGLLALGLTLLTAMSLGYRTTGSLAAMTSVGLLSTLGVIAISLIVAALLRTIFDLMTIGCFPFFILMFFSGGMIPLPPLPLFSWGGRSIIATDILPTTHTITALGKIMNNDAGLGDVTFELAAIALLTVAYFTAGVWLFKRRHLRAK